MHEDVENWLLLLGIVARRSSRETRTVRDGHHAVRSNATITDCDHH
jgi:hypothetical protein